MTYAEVVPLFPTPLARSLNVLSDEQCDALLEYCKTTSYYYTNPEDLTSVKISTDANVLNTFPNIKEKIETIITQTLRIQLGCVNSFQLKITSSWATSTNLNSTGHQHSHFNSFWSGVIYFTDDVSPIYFHRPKVETSLKPNTNKVTPFNVDVSVHIPQKGELIFFPSHIYHNISCNNSNDFRYSIAFNTMPIGMFGSPTAGFNIQSVDDITVSE